MGKATPAAQNSSALNASSPLGSSPPIEGDPFSGGNLDRQSPETEENSFAGGNPNNDDDDDVEAALEADELLVFDPSLAADDPNADPDQLSFLDTGDHLDEVSKDESDSSRHEHGGLDEASLLTQYWWLACLPICVILLLQFMPLPNWFTG